MIIGGIKNEENETTYSGAKERIRELEEEALEERREEARKYFEEFREEFRKSGAHVEKTENGFVLTTRKK